MCKNLYCKILTFGIIVLFMGVVIHPAFANIVNKSLVDDNHPPNKPKIDGPKLGRPGTHEWTFCATDPDGDNVSYQIDWDDGTYENWTDFYPSGEVITRRHTYNIYGDFELCAYAKDIHNDIGPKGTYPVIMTQSKQRGEDCNCKEIDSIHLVRLERQLNRLEVYSKLLLVLSRDNPEIQVKIEELLDEITTLKEELGDDPSYPVICGILINILNGLYEIVRPFQERCESSEPYTLSYIIWCALYQIVVYILAPIWGPIAGLAVLLRCFDLKYD